MAKVKSNEIAMKPKWYFVIGSIFMFAGVVASSIGAVFLTNLSLFLLRQHGPRGQYKVQQMIESFPWWIPMLAVGGIILGVWMLRRYDFSYRKNFLLIASGFVLAILSTAFLIDVLGISNYWFKQGPMRRLYRQIEMQTDDTSKKSIPERGQGRGRMYRIDQ